jgi:hypothetical protein
MCDFCDLLKCGSVFAAVVEVGFKMCCEEAEDGSINKTGG